MTQRNETQMRVSGADKSIEVRDKRDGKRWGTFDVTNGEAAALAEARAFADSIDPRRKWAVITNWLGEYSRVPSSDKGADRGQ